MTVVPFMRKSSVSPTLVHCMTCLEETFTSRYGELTGEEQEAVASRLPSIMAYLTRRGDPSQVLRMELLSNPAVRWLIVSLGQSSKTLLQEALNDLDTVGGVRFGRFLLNGYEIETLVATIADLIEVLTSHYCAGTAESEVVTG